MASNGGHTVFHREADHWSIEYDGKVVRLPHTRGLDVLAHLIGNPRRRFRASDLLPLLPSEPPANCGKTRSDRRLSPGPGNDYRTRLYSLREGLRRAREIKDEAGARILEREMEALTQELARAVGLAVDQNGASADQLVREAVASAIASIAKSNRGFASHLGRTIATGRVFSYTPE